MTGLPEIPSTAIRYFAPAVQVLTLPAKPAAGPQIGGPLDADILGDLVRTEVTLVNSGCSQYALTFNNWSTGLPGNNGNSSGTARPGGAGRLDWPRYKYNDLQRLYFGQRLRIDMRYWPNVTEESSLADQWSHSWTPMISGPITDMKFNFGQGAEVTVSGEDDLSGLKDRPEHRKEFSSPKSSERQIVDQILKLANYPLTAIAEPRVEWPPFTTDPSQANPEALDDNQSYFEYLDKLAKRLDFEFFVAFELTRPDSPLEFHFEPARSRATPDHHKGEVFTLSRDKHLIDFNPTIKPIDQPTEVIIKGRHQDRERPERVQETVSLSVLENELHIDASKGDQALVTGPAIRARYFPDRPNPDTVPNNTNINSARGKWLAEVKLRNTAREFFTIEATTIGLPRLRPGNHVEIRGMGPPFDGFFYLTKTVHSYGADGYRTKLSARRPGMPNPGSQEKL